MGQRLIKALKAINFISGKNMTEEELIKHRRMVDWVGSMATPKGDVKIRKFSVNGIPCEAVRPEFAHNPQYGILYAHGGGYFAGGLDYARVLAVKMALATGFTTYSFAYRLFCPYLQRRIRQRKVPLLWMVRQYGSTLLKISICRKSSYWQVIRQAVIWLCALPKS